MKFILGITLTVLLTSGCVSRIDQPVASRPLVENVVILATESIPQMHWTKLSNAMAGAMLTIDGDKMILGERYIAASGDTCIALYPADMIAKRSTTVCNGKDSMEWHYARPVIAFHSEALEVSQ
jgi:hypothetical protein